MKVIRTNTMFKTVIIMFFFFIYCPLAAVIEGEQNTIDIVKKNVNSVVFITNIQYIEDFFYGGQNVARGTGSGFIWDTRGHIVTNYHVIEDGDIFAVTCPNQKTYRAKLVGKEPAKDIAVLKITVPDGKFSPVKVGVSRTLQVGQKVIAIGNPFGFDHTVTTGIVSALGRSIKGVEGITIRNMIQTDASINPGNSGGPLLDSNGELIGMNTMIYSSTGNYAGIGFALPVDTINKIVPQIIQFGKVIRPGIGVSFLDDKYAQRLGIKGVVVIEVPRNSNAQRAGLKGVSRNRYGQLILGDIIIGINDIELESYDDLYNALDNFRIGENVILTVKRNDKEKKIRMKLVRID